MTVKETDTHPSQMSDADKKEMDDLVAAEVAELHGAGDEAVDAGKTVGAAGDETNTDQGAGDDAGDKGAAAAEAGKAEAAAAGAAPPAAAADEGAAAGESGETAVAAAGDAGKVSTVDRKQYDGVLAELRDTRSVNQLLRTALTKPMEQLPPRDFDAEDKALDERVAALDKRYDSEGLSDEDYRNEQRTIERDRRALDRDRNKYELLDTLQKEREANEQLAAAQAKEAAEKAWDDAREAWSANLGDWLKNPVRRATVNQTMEMMNADPELSQLDHAAYLAKLDTFLGEAFADYPGKKTASAGGGDAASGPNERQQLAAKRAAEVGASPPRIEGGVGNRGTGTADIDINKIPLGRFKDLPKAKQNELLGIE